MDAGSTQGARILICGHRWTSHKAKRRWLVGVTTLAFQGYAIATTAASSSAANRSLSRAFEAWQVLELIT
jgi:hypothetical protein